MSLSDTCTCIATYTYDYTVHVHVLWGWCRSDWPRSTYFLSESISAEPCTATQLTSEACTMSPVLWSCPYLLSEASHLATCNNWGPASCMGQGPRTCFIKGNGTCTAGLITAGPVILSTLCSYVYVYICSSLSHCSAVASLVVSILHKLNVRPVAKVNAVASRYGQRRA